MFSRRRPWSVLAQCQNGFLIEWIPPKAGFAGIGQRRGGEKGIGEVFIICWNAGGKVPLERALQECKFVHLFSAKMIWYNKKELYCPYCKGRCKCDAEVYFKKVKERNCK